MNELNKKEEHVEGIVDEYHTNPLTQAIRELENEGRTIPKEEQEYMKNGGRTITGTQVIRIKMEVDTSELDIAIMKLEKLMGLYSEYSGKLQKPVEIDMTKLNQYWNNENQK